MRVISQDGRIDYPYKQSIVFIDPRGTHTVLIQPVGERKGFALGIYSTEAKAIKAAKMLREQYARLETIKALASGTCQHMEESLEPEEFKDILKKYINMEVFQFPEDSKIEVSK